MTKRGRLNNTEKYAIQGMIAQDISVEDIASQLDRSEKSVKNYIDGELDDVVSHIVQARMEAFENAADIEAETPISNPKRRRFTDLDEGEIQKAKPEEPSSELEEHVSHTIPPEFQKAAYDKLLNAGLIENDARRVVRAAVAAAEKSGLAIRNGDHLFTECVKRMRAGQFMQKRTTGGNQGVAVMTGNASARLDEAQKNNAGRIHSRSARGNVFNPSTGEVE
jgi:hypothetical protein